jgi:hypothetical protein
VGDDIPIDSEMILVTDFVNLKIKPTQFFGGAHKVGCAYVCSYERVLVRVRVYVFVLCF